MPTLVCFHCSHVLEGVDVMPSECPVCGHTFPIDDDSTRTHHPQLMSTVLQVVDPQPRSIGRYLIKSELGQGGFGSVYLAEDPQLDRLVAIKVPRQQREANGETLDRFAREGRSAAQLRHEGIVSVYNVEDDGNVPFIVSEYIEGQTLYERLRNGPPYSFPDAARLVAALASAVGYAHSKGVIHRDIKPANVMMASDGTPRLMDFGMAKRESATEALITADHRVLGTPAYMSPEQARGRSAAIDRRTDIYSLGVVLYQLLTRELPFRGEPRMVLQQVIDDEPRPPRSLDGGIPLDLETICLKAMEKEPSQRFQTAGELDEELQRWLHHEPIHARPITRLERGWRWCRRNPAVAALSASILLLLTTLACGATVLAAKANEGRQQEHDARTQAEQLVRQRDEALRDKDRALLESHRLLSKSYVERGNRHLSPFGGDEYSPNRALPWFYAATEIDDSDPERRDAGRIRLGCALRSCPSVENLWTHPGGLTCAAISPSGEQIFTGGHDGTGRLWDPAKSDPTSRNLIHPESIVSAKFSPDGKYLLTSCDDGTVRLWEIPSGKLVVGPLRDSEFAKEAIKDGSVSLAFGTSGRRFATCRGRAVQVWEVPTGRAIGAPVIGRGKIGSAEFAASDRLFVTSSADGSITTWDAESGKEKLRLRSGPRMNTLEVVAPDGTTVAGTIAPDVIDLWNCETGERIGLPPLVHGIPVSDFRFSPDGRFLLSWTKDGAVHVWRRADGKLVWKNRLFTTPILRLAFVAGSTVAIGTNVSGRVDVVDIESGNLVAEPIGLPSMSAALGWVGQTGALATFSYDGTVRVWKMENQDPAFMLPLSANIACAAASADGHVVATLDRDGTCCFLRAAASQSFESTDAKTFATNAAKATAIVLSADGSKFVVAGAKTSLSVFDSATAKLLSVVDPGSQTVAMAFTPDNQSLITVSQADQRSKSPGRIGVWSAATGERLHVQSLDSPAPLRGADIAAADRCAIAIGKQVIVCDPIGGSRVSPVFAHESGVISCRLSPNRQLLLTACVDGIASVWELRSGKRLASTSRSPLGLRCAEFSPDGARFAAGGEDGTVRIYRTADARPACPIINHGRAVTACYISPDSRWLLTQSGDYLSTKSGAYVGGPQSQTLIRAWNASTGEPVFCRAPRQLTSRFPRDSTTTGADPWRLASAFFSAHGARFHAITMGGVFLTVELPGEAHSAAQLLREVAVRSGFKPDASGGLLLLEPEQLVSTWKGAGDP